MKLKLDKILHNNNNKFCVFQNDTFTSDIFIRIHPNRDISKNGIFLYKEYIELKTKLAVTWTPEKIIKIGLPLVWNFGDGSGNIIGNLPIYTPTYAESYTRYIRIGTSDGFESIVVMELEQLEPVDFSLAHDINSIVVA